jgi:hypothetical protein
VVNIQIPLPGQDSAAVDNGSRKRAVPPKPGHPQGPKTANQAHQCTWHAASRRLAHVGRHDRNTAFAIIRSHRNRLSEDKVFISAGDTFQADAPPMHSGHSTRRFGHEKLRQDPSLGAARSAHFASARARSRWQPRNPTLIGTGVRHTGSLRCLLGREPPSYRGPKHRPGGTHRLRSGHRATPPSQDRCCKDPLNPTGVS